MPRVDCLPIAPRVAPDADSNTRLPVDGAQLVPTLDRKCSVERCETTAHLTGAAVHVVEARCRRHHRLVLAQAGTSGDVGRLVIVPAIESWMG